MYFAQHGTEGGPAISAAGERSAAGAFELDVVAHPVAADHFAQQVGAAIAELGYEVSELVAGVGECERFGAVGYAVAR